MISNLVEQDDFVALLISQKLIVFIVLLLSSDLVLAKVRRMLHSCARTTRVIAAGFGPWSTFATDGFGGNRDG